MSVTDDDGKGALMERQTFGWFLAEYEKARAVRNRVRWLIQREQTAGLIVHSVLFALLALGGGFHERLSYSEAILWALFVVSGAAFYMAAAVPRPGLVELLSEASTHLGIAIGAQGRDTAAGAESDARRRVHIWAEFERRLCELDRKWEPLRPFTGEGRSVRLWRPPAPPPAPPPSRTAPPPSPPDGEGPTP